MKRQRAVKEFYERQKRAQDFREYREEQTDFLGSRHRGSSVSSAGARTQRNCKCHIEDKFDCPKIKH